MDRNTLYLALGGGLALLTLRSGTGDKIMNIAARTWRENIHDNESGASKIDDIIANGVYRTAQKVTPYVPQTYQWCGAFAGFCYRSVHMNSKILANTFPSTYRLTQFAQYKKEPTGNAYGYVVINGQKVKVEDWHKSLGKPRLYAKCDSSTSVDKLPFHPMRGDIILIGNKQWYGDHVCLVDKVRGNEVDTIEGNAIGKFPDGTEGEGVIRQVRRFGITGESRFISHIIRPSTLDFSNNLELVKW